MVAYNYGPTWAERTRTHGRDSVRLISASVIAETKKALLLKAARRTVWLPRRMVTPDPDQAVFWIPSWLCEEKLLD